MAILVSTRQALERSEFFSGNLFTRAPGAFVLVLIDRRFSYAGGRLASRAEIPFLRNLCQIVGIGIATRARARSHHRAGDRAGE